MTSYSSETTAQPQPGDLLEITNNFSKQWALYLCDGYVLSAVPLDKMSQATPCKKSFIKMQLLEEAVGSGAFKVNNKYDSEFPAFHYEKIIHKAQILIDTEVSTDLLGTDCEQFVIWLRYGDNISIQDVRIASQRCCLDGMDYLPPVGEATAYLRLYISWIDYSSHL